MSVDQKPLKILCVADHQDPLVYSINAKSRFKDVDLVLSAGDLPMEYLGFIASTLNKEVLFVFGNHNLRHYQLFKNRHKGHGVMNLNVSDMFTNYYGSTYIGDRIVRRKGLLIAGFGGSIRYNDGENQYTDRQMWWKMIRLIPRLLINKLMRGRYLDILLTHSAPYGVNDRDDPCHRGFKAFNWFVKRYKPRYLLHGHIHLYNPNEARENRIGETEIINVYDHFVLEVPPRN